MIPSDELPERKPPFRVTDESSANWALRRLHEVKAAATHVEAVYAHERALLDGWRDRALSQTHHDVEWAEGLLLGWLRERMDADEDLRTIDLPLGQIKARAAKGSVTVDDEAAVIAWAEDRGIAEKVTKRSVVAASLRQATGEQDGALVDPSTGEAVPGVHIERAEPFTYSVSTSQEG